MSLKTLLNLEAELSTVRADMLDAMVPTLAMTRLAVYVGVAQGRVSSDLMKARRSSDTCSARFS